MLIKRSSAPRSWIEWYGERVLDGRIIACKRVKQLYTRLLTEINTSGGRWVYRPDVSARHIAFVERFCRQSQGDLGAPLLLEPFQKARFDAVFGVLDRDDGTRRFREVNTVEGRKNGKTTEMAAVGVDLLLHDGEGAPEIYFAATKREQAAKGWIEMGNMLRQSPSLKRHIKKRVADIYCPENLGFARPLSSNTNSLDGLNGHGIIIDELAAIKNRDLYDLLKQSTSSKTRRQPLLYTISTNGFVRENIFDSQYDYACAWLDGTITDERFLPFVYELDDPDEWRSEDMWIKANPGLGTIKNADTLRGFVDKALSDVSFRPTVMVKDFNVKQTGDAAWLRWEELDNPELLPEGLSGYCVGGFDAADSTDLQAAKIVVCRRGDPKLYVKSMYWLPEAVLDEQAKSGDRRGRDAVPYELWVQRGLLRTVPGNRMGRRVVLDWFCEMRDHGFYTLYIGYDPWHVGQDTLDDFAAEFGRGCMRPVRQGAATLSRPMKDLRADLGAGLIVYDNNPIDKWCLANTNVRMDVNGNIQPIHPSDRAHRNDGALALLDAYTVLGDARDEIEAMNEG